MIVVDTSVWVGWIRREQTDAVSKLELLIDKDVIILGDLILFEILQGARDDLHAKRLERVLARYRSADMLNQRLAVVVASNYRLLRAKGITTRSAADLMIGTWCIENNVPLLHNDRDFTPMVEHLGLIEL